jgi:hypothetical protein
LVIISLEFFEYGSFLSWHNIDSINLYRYAGAGGLINLFAELILTIVFIVFTVMQIVKIVKTGCRYFKDFWNMMAVLCIILYFSAIGVYVWRSILTSQKVEDIMNNRGKLCIFSLF